MKYAPPKAIAAHAGVEVCESGEQNGADYRHDVFLREGWRFTSGRMEGCRSGLFHTVRDFAAAKPRQVTP